MRASLTGDTLWRLVLNLESPDKKTSVKAVARIRFIEERGYEPPSGVIFVEDDFQGLIRVNEKGYSPFRWTLSEDKEDRKDGLWVLGLFAEPKYPYLYFSLGCFDSVVLASGEEQPFAMLPEATGDGQNTGIPGDKLNFRFFHENKGAEGRVLSGGTVTFKASEMLNLPLTQVDIGEEVVAGRVELSPVRESLLPADADEATAE
tara:strand:- start:442 stop:1053 length:612 start_codon:yes stop_codon:yes gene_type:complete